MSALRNYTPPSVAVSDADSPLEIPAGLASRYDRIVLVSCPEHLEGIDVGNQDQLIVSSDWLTWRLCRQRGGATVHLDAFASEWPGVFCDAATWNLRSNEWMYVNGRDITEFRGISLGKQFIRGVSQFSLQYKRTRYALERLCATFGPRRIVLKGLYAKNRVLGVSAIRHLVLTVADARRIVVEDRLVLLDPDHPLLPERIAGVAHPESESKVRKVLRVIVTGIIDGGFSCRDLFLGRRKTVLLMLNWNVARSLIEDHDSSDLSPLLIADYTPKSLKFLWNRFRRGHVQAALPSARLTSAERIVLDEILERIEHRWEQCSDSFYEALRDFIRGHVIESGWLEQQAIEVKRYQSLFRRHRISCLVLGDTTSTVGRLAAEVARQAGVTVEEYLNGMFLTPQRYDSRCGDSGSRPVVDGLLSRGEHDERWLEITGASIRTTRVGWALPMAPERVEHKPNFKGRALVLPIYADGDDVVAFNSTIFATLVQTVAALKQYGCAEIRVKLHIGPPNLSYYRAVLDAGGFFDTELIKDGEFQKHVEWADFVVGPVNSGAWIETLAARKPYFPMLIQPSLIDRRFLSMVDVVESVDDLREMLRTERMPDSARVLETFCSTASIAYPGRRLWQALSKAGLS